ncbi:hypothetical protein ACSQ67_008119 [Phaseolus vulgaris]
MSASQNNLAMSCREDSDVEEVLPVQVQRKDIVNTVQSKPFPSTQLHVGSSSHFKLPHGWIVEEKPRPSNPAHFDRYFYEPFTGRKFRSLSSVRKHLAQEAGHHDVTGRMISNATNTNTHPSEYGKGQQLEEKASIAIPKWWEVKSDTGEKKVRGPRSCSSCRNRANKPAESSGKKPMKVDNQKEKSNSEKDKTPVHNLIGPPPEKVSWVLSSREGFWNPYVDGVAVSEAERLKWAEAFVLSIRASEY